MDVSGPFDPLPEGDQYDPSTSESAWYTISDIIMDGLPHWEGRGLLYREPWTKGISVGEACSDANLVRTLRRTSPCFPLSPPFRTPLLVGTFGTSRRDTGSCVGFRREASRASCGLCRHGWTQCPRQNPSRSLAHP